MRDDSDVSGSLRPTGRRSGPPVGMIVVIVAAVFAAGLLLVAGAVGVGLLAFPVRVTVTPVPPQAVQTVPMAQAAPPVAAPSKPAISPAAKPEGDEPKVEKPKGEDRAGSAAGDQVDAKPKETSEKIIAALRNTDEEIMRHFRKGEKAEGVQKLKVVVKKYDGKPPAKCEKDEALAVAVMRTRLITIEADGMPEAEMKSYLETSLAYATRSGLSVSEWKDATREVVRKTVLATK